MVQSTMESSNKALEKEMGLFYTVMGIYMMESGKKGKLMEKENILGKMGINMLVISKLV